MVTYYCDAFALTRVGADDKVKNAYDYCGDIHAPLSANGSRVLVNWKGRTSTLLDAQTLKRIKKGFYFTPERILEDGRALYSFGIGVGGWCGSRWVVQPFGIVSHPPRLLEPGAYPENPPIALGGAEPATYFCPAVSWGARLVVVDRVIRYCDLSKDPVTRWNQPVLMDETARLARLHIGPYGVVLAAWSPRDGALTLVWLGHDGMVMGRWEVRSLDLPAVSDDGKVYFQSSDERLTRLTLESGVEGRISLPGLVAAARTRARAKALDRVDTGPGRLVAGGRVLFVPWHAASLLDVEAAVEIPRKLKKSVDARRQVVTPCLTRRRQEMLDSGLYGLSVLSVNGKGQMDLGFSFGTERDAGRDRCLKGVVSELEEALDLRCVGRSVGRY